MRYLIVTFVTALVAYTVQAEPPLYSVSSKAHGTEFDLVVTEIKREPSKSYLSVPGFHKRSAKGSRWLMCAYTDLAITRGFSYWSVMYPTPDNETVVVAFTNSSTASPQDLFDAEFDKDRNIGVGQVEKFAVICGLRSAVQSSHIEANVPPPEAFGSILRRDLLVYFSRKDSSVTSVEFKLLREAPTQSGVAYPKYYAWVKAFADSTPKEEGAVRVAAIDRERFEVTNFMSKAKVQSAPSEVGVVFPAALVQSIISLASAK